MNDVSLDMRTSIQNHDDEKLSIYGQYYPFKFNLLSPHDTLKHHFKSVKTDFIFLQLRVLERKVP